MHTKFQNKVRILLERELAEILKKLKQTIADDDGGGWSLRLGLWWAEDFVKLWEIDEIVENNEVIR